MSSDSIRIGMARKDQDDKTWNLKLRIEAHRVEKRRDLNEEPSAARSKVKRKLL